MRGDVLSGPGRFAPLQDGHPGVGDVCVLCDRPLIVGDRVALIEWAPGSVEDADKAAQGRAHNLECKIAHETCAFKDGAA